MTCPRNYDRDPAETKYGITGFRIPLWVLIAFAVGITFFV